MENGFVKVRVSENKNLLYKKIPLFSKSNLEKNITDRQTKMIKPLET
jgi:hypothetical protein